MKALITAFALLSFVAATTIPLAAQAQTQSSDTQKPMAKKKVTKSHKTAAKKSHKKVAKKKKKSTAPMSSMPAKG